MFRGRRPTAETWDEGSDPPPYPGSSLSRVPSSPSRAHHSGFQAAGPHSWAGAHTTSRPPSGARTQGCLVAVGPQRPHLPEHVGLGVPGAPTLSWVGALRSGKQKLQVSTGSGGPPAALPASIQGSAEWGVGRVRCLSTDPSSSALHPGDSQPGGGEDGALPGAVCPALLHRAAPPGVPGHPPSAEGSLCRSRLSHLG